MSHLLAHQAPPVSYHQHGTAIASHVTRWSSTASTTTPSLEYCWTAAQVRTSSAKIRRLRSLVTAMHWQMLNLRRRNMAAVSALQSISPSRATSTLAVQAGPPSSPMSEATSERNGNISGRCHFRNDRLYDGPRRLYECEEDDYHRCSATLRRIVTQDGRSLQRW